MEQERRRLSRYQTVQADRINNTPASKRESGSKTVDRKAYGPSSRTDFTKAHQRGKKYVVDNSKPRTDLEYDPLSNFSADLLSLSSLTKEQKLKSRQVKDKSPESTAPCIDKEPFAYQAPLSRSPSPEPLDVSSEGEDLIIDVPPSPEKTGQRTAKSVAGKSSQVTAVEVKGGKKEPNLPNSPSPHNKITLSSSDSNKIHHYSVENSQDLLTISPAKESEDLKNGANVVDLTDSPDDLANECQKITKAVLEKIPKQQDHNLNNPQCELPSIFEKMNPQKTPMNLLFCKSPAANSSRRQVPQDRVQSHRCSEKSTPSAVMGNQKKSSKMSGQTQGIAADGDKLPLEQAEQGSENSEFEGRHVLSTYVSSQFGAEPCSEQNLVMVNDEEVILINSSSDEEEEGPNHSAVELSDSDPMEECYRIFMEANNEGKGTEETPSACVSSL